MVDFYVQTSWNVESLDILDMPRPSQVIMVILTDTQDTSTSGTHVFFFIKRDERVIFLIVRLYLDIRKKVVLIIDKLSNVVGAHDFKCSPPVLVPALPVVAHLNLNSSSNLKRRNGIT